MIESPLPEPSGDEPEVTGITPVRVAEVMTRKITRIRHDANLFQGAEIVATTGVTDLMVVDDSSEFVGVLSVGDILRAAVPGVDLADVRIAGLVIREPIVARADDPVDRVVAVLLRMVIGRLPVLDGGGRLIGTVSRADICRAMVGER